MIATFYMIRIKNIGGDIRSNFILIVNNLYS